MREITLSRAVNEALAEGARRDPNVFLIGDDIAEAGTPINASSGLVEKIGADRVIDAPVSEPGFIGMAVGAAMTGVRPVVDLMFGGFPLSGNGPALLPGGQDALHVRRQAEGAAGPARRPRRHPSLGGPALPEPLRARRPCRRAECGTAVLRLRGRGPAEDRDPRRRLGGGLRGQA